MALRPDILLQGRVPDISNSIPNALLTFQQVQAGKERREQAPIRNRLLEAQVGAAEQAAEQARQENRISSIAVGALELLPVIQTGNIDAVRSKLLQRKSELEGQGIPANDTDEALAMLDAPGGLLELQRVTESAVDMGRQFGVVGRSPTGTASGRDFEQFQALSRRAEATGDPADIKAAEQFGRQSGFARETAQELADIGVQKAGDIEAAKAAVELDTSGKIEGTKAASVAAIKRSEKAFDSIGKIRLSIDNYDEAIELIDNGAETGVVQSRLPSIRAASIALDNLQGRLGLDVVGQTTFGALSESELKFALATALPKKLAPADLRRWLVRKKESQLKLSAYLQEVATFLGTPGNTTKDFVELQKVRQLEQESAISDSQPVVSQPSVDLSTLSDQELIELRKGAQ